jgi:hypothetical protein
MPKSRVLHARITDEIHEKLSQKCDTLGCSITDYVTSVLDNSFESDTEPKPIITVVDV